MTGIANVPTDSLCDDSDVCTGTETCDAVLDCQAGTPLMRDDGVSCTVDSCDPGHRYRQRPDRQPLRRLGRLHRHRDLRRGARLSGWHAAGRG